MLAEAANVIPLLAMWEGEKNNFSSVENKMKTTIAAQHCYLDCLRIDKPSQRSSVQIRLVGGGTLF